MRRVVPYIVFLVIGLVAGRLLIEIHTRLADLHEGLAFGLVLAELGAVAGLFVARRLRRRRRRLEAPPSL